MQTLINRALRIMTFAPFGHIDLKPLYKDLNILDVEGTFYLETSKFMYKRKNDLLPVTFANHFENNESSHQSVQFYGLRSGVRRNHIVPRLISSEKSIQVRGENLWNEIPEIVKANTSLNSFKRLVKCMLLIN